jgi:hypothetical protein
MEVLFLMRSRLTCEFCAPRLRENGEDEGSKETGIARLLEPAYLMPEIRIIVSST